MSWKSAALALAMTVSVSAGAAAQPTASFRLNGVRFEVPIPSGYCLPQGELAAFALRAAAADNQNVTHLTLYDCQQQHGDRLVDYILIKTPIQTLGLTVTRDQLLAAWGAELASAPSDQSLLSDEGLERIEERIASVMGTQIDLTGAVRPLGRDSLCVYLGGTFAVSLPSGSHTSSAGACATAVADRVITINWYGADRGARGITELLARARQLASRIRGHRDR